MSVVNEIGHLKTKFHFFIDFCNSWFLRCHSARQVMGDHDTDVAEYLYKPGATRAGVIKLLCKDLSKACVGKVPPVPKVLHNILFHTYYLNLWVFHQLWWLQWTGQSARRIIHAEGRQRSWNGEAHALYECKSMINPTCPHFSNSQHSHLFSVHRTCLGRLEWKCFQEKRLRRIPT